MLCSDKSNSISSDLTAVSEYGEALKFKNLNIMVKHCGGGVMGFYDKYICE